MKMNYYRDIIFSKSPLTGGYTFKDKFQIFPASLKNQPTSIYAKDHPIIVEYALSDEELITPSYVIEGLEQFSIETASRVTKVEEIIRLLCTFTNHFFFRYESGSGFWGMPIINDNPGKEANNWSSVWCFKMLFWPDYPKEMKIDSFSEIENFVELVPHHPYFFIKPNLDMNPSLEITFPYSFEQFAESYFNSTEAIKSVVLKAMNHLYNAVDLMYRKQTLSIISAFTSLETMINEEYKEQKIEFCEACGQPKFKVSKKFKDYLSTYVGQNTSLKKKFNLYYKKRSKIVHTGQELATEDLYSNLPKSERDSDSITHQEVIQITRLGISHWLYKKTRPSKPV